MRIGGVNQSLRIDPIRQRGQARQKIVRSGEIGVAGGEGLDRLGRARLRDRVGPEPAALADGGAGQQLGISAGEGIDRLALVLIGLAQAPGQGPLVVEMPIGLGEGGVALAGRILHGDVVEPVQHRGQRGGAGSGAVGQPGQRAVEGPGVLLVHGVGQARNRLMEVIEPRHPVDRPIGGRRHAEFLGFLRDMVDEIGVGGDRQRGEIGVVIGGEGPALIGRDRGQGITAAEMPVALAGDQELMGAVILARAGIDDAGIGRVGRHVARRDQIGAAREIVARRRFRLVAEKLISALRPVGAVIGGNQAIGEIVAGHIKQLHAAAIRIAGVLVAIAGLVIEKAVALAVHAGHPQRQHVVDQRNVGHGLILAEIVIAVIDLGGGAIIESRRLAVDIDRAAGGVAPIKRALRPAQHFGMIDIEEVIGELAGTAEIDAILIDADAALQPVADLGGAADAADRQDGLARIGLGQVQIRRHLLQLSRGLDAQQVQRRAADHRDRHRHVLRVLGPQPGGHLDFLKTVCIGHGCTGKENTGKGNTGKEGILHGLHPEFEKAGRYIIQLNNDFAINDLLSKIPHV